LSTKPNKFVLDLTVDPSENGERLDIFVSSHVARLSRSLAARMIRAGQVIVNGETRKPAYLIRSGDVIHLEGLLHEPVEFQPEPIPIPVIYEDQDILLIDKPPGLVTHPAPGHKKGTLVNALLFHCQTLSGIGGKLRPGIVHRLDKDTSGTMVVAKNDLAHESLSRQFKNREVSKCYVAVVYGCFELDHGSIGFPIGRHPADRRRMSVLSHSGREAETLWRVRERFSEITLLELELKSGRTHQIRVHCSAINHPIVGDYVYGGQKRYRTLKTKGLQELIRSVPRQMLHAWRLSFKHPRSGEKMVFESDLPEDMEVLLERLRMIEKNSASPGRKP